jgi:ABC-2 type transport system ATP-binding protein
MEDFAIKAENVSKTFKLPREKHTSLKSVFVNAFSPKKGYDLQRALDDVSFEVKKGEFFGIVGRNGSGKSTLLKLLAGIYTPTTGQIHIRGSLTPFIELGVGFNPELTGRENVYLNGALLGFNRKEMNRMYKDIVSFAELEKFMDQKLKNYSSGMQVRLAFSIAIRAQSDILLLDEVLAVGDAAFQQKCYNYFEDLKKQSKTVVFVSHDMDAVKRFCNSAVYIKDGSLTHAGTAAEIADIYAVENFQSSQEKDDSGLAKRYYLEIDIKKQTAKKVDIEIRYRSKDKTKMYVGISVLRDGISIAEISTYNLIDLVGKGKVIYELNLETLNSGRYQIGGGLFKYDNRELLAAADQRPEFLIKGDDPTKGAALKLPDSWKV